MPGWTPPGVVQADAPIPYKQVAPFLEFGSGWKRRGGRARADGGKGGGQSREQSSGMEVSHTVRTRMGSGASCGTHGHERHDRRVCAYWAFNVLTTNSGDVTSCERKRRREALSMLVFPFTVITMSR